MGRAGQWKEGSLPHEKDGWVVLDHGQVLDQGQVHASLGPLVGSPQEDRQKLSILSEHFTPG